MLQKVDSTAAAPAAPFVKNLHLMLMAHYNEQHPIVKKQCRFMLFIRLRPGIPSHFKNMARTGYYRGDKFTDKEPDMLRNLIKMIDKRQGMYDRIIIYDNERDAQEREILKITDHCIECNFIPLYSLMLTKFILPEWLRK